MQIHHKDHIHHTEAELAACIAAERCTAKHALAYVIALAVIVLGLEIGHAILFYGDWTCAFAECRKVVR